MTGRQLVGELNALYANRAYGALDALLGRHNGMMFRDPAYFGPPRLGPEIIKAAGAAWDWDQSLALDDARGSGSPRVVITPRGRGFHALEGVWYHHVAGRRYRRLGRTTHQGPERDWADFTSVLLAQFEPGDIVEISTEPVEGSVELGKDGHGHMWHAQRVGRMW